MKHLLNSPKTLISGFGASFWGTPLKYQASRFIQTISDASSYANFKQSLTAQSPQQLHLLQFSATWCGPCQRIKPQIQELSQKYKQVAFSCIDVDQIQEATADHNITSVPTFILFKGQSKVDRLEGSHLKSLEEKIEKHIKPS